eukprot:CAMPEP_0197666934 /NCGR_PEP_ID=MMETSP1338-20131121/64506_1 /TAXON_ID=43686 ORGANISM="Pelagodinium beii, Strain RCC1491" /NCGR_SAMPLE_ID=MMETSP1338 /ASSEMBLY_ACC=CAM_ASM_000754 /LENGTH=247 /DNA_ID=CAMNT_0043246071 /DNA_START=39 /DNA_END=782 /DNA_ORIENTATION=-
MEHWLMSAIDKEKQEKAWLAVKYEEKCDEIASLRQELDQLRPMLSGGASSTAAAAVEVRPNTPLKGMQPAVMQKAFGDVVRTPKAEVTEGSPSKLTERRGLQLSVDIGQKRPGAPVKALQPHEPFAPPQPIVVNMPQPRLSTSKAEPSQEEAYRDEPMSALLRRRKEEWSLKALAPAGDDDSLQRTVSMGALNNGPLSPLLETQDPAYELPVVKAVTEAPLQLSAQKFEMDLDCPQSPKRVKKNSGF